MQPVDTQPERHVPGPESRPVPPPPRLCCVSTRNTWKCCLCMLRFCLYIRLLGLFSSQRVNKCWATGNNSAAAESPSHGVMCASRSVCSAVWLLIWTLTLTFTHMQTNLSAFRIEIHSVMHWSASFHCRPRVTHRCHPGFCGHLAAKLRWKCLENPLRTPNRQQNKVYLLERETWKFPKSTLSLMEKSSAALENLIILNES